MLMENPGTGLGQSQKCTGVKSFTEIPTLLLIIGSPMAIQIQQLQYFCSVNLDTHMFLKLISLLEETQV